MGDETPLVLGDLEVPARTHVTHRLMTHGVLRIGDGCVCDGDVLAGRAVYLGKGAVIHGDVVSGGPVYLHLDVSVDGRVRAFDPGFRLTSHGAPPEPKAPRPERLGPVPLAETESELLRASVQETLQVMYLVALADHRKGGPRVKGAWFGLAEDAVQDMVAAVRGPIAKVYQQGRRVEVWSADDVFDVFFRRIVPLVLPISVLRETREKARITLGPPPDLAGEPGGTKGWAVPALALLELIGGSLHPGLRVEAFDAARLADPAADPPRVHAAVTLPELVH